MEKRDKNKRSPMAVYGRILTSMQEIYGDKKILVIEPKSEKNKNNHTQNDAQLS